MSVAEFPSTQRPYQRGRVCDEPDCGRPHCAKGKCSYHYDRLFRTDYFRRHHIRREAMRRKERTARIMSALRGTPSHPHDAEWTSETLAAHLYHRHHRRFLGLPRVTELADVHRVLHELMEDNAA